ncbi:polyhydroxyalkanoate depolymerase [uncultured Ferrovibrio sp.]|jgi:polyhydroxyalkanoate depolymerase, intracellular|uniref:polyhydroxyalkanoate depolymerase n=1 Tax=uncultured Ferrovibrio sp. TaxID=1576913 RepID=UPI00262CA6A2|nr:polyhydroxyalkanoate depolymerase [uncultured Ferrovibrio sp.]
MLYSLYELQHAALQPMRALAEAQSQALKLPYLPLNYTPAARTLAASLEVFQTITKRYAKPEFGLHTTLVDGEPRKVVERVVVNAPFCQLKHFEREGCEKRNDPKLLIVAPLSGHYATLLRGTVEAMLPNHEVYITDWRDARDIPLREGPFELDDYIEYVREFLDILGPGCHVMAVCQPSVPVLAAVALMSADNDPNVPRSMTLMGGPIDTRISPTVPNKLAQERSIEWFEHSVIDRVPFPHAGFMRPVYPGFIQLTGFMTMNLDRHVGAHVRLFHHLIKGDGDSVEAHNRFYDEYLAVMDLPAEYYLQTVKRVFQDHDLPRNTFTCRGEKVDTRAIRKTALLTVEGEKDDISGVGQTRAAHDICPNIPNSKRAHHLQEGVGHYGVFNGRRWRENIAPKVAAFIRQHNKG